MSVAVSASILACDLLNLEKAIKDIENAGIDMIHYDVMDGVFVPSITYGDVILSKISKITNLPLDVHLMTVNPLNQIDLFANAGADMITFHLESDSDVMDTIKAVKSHGIKVGISIKPDTKAEAVLPYIDYVDSVLVMTVEPGKGGQAFMESTLEKVSDLNDYIALCNLKCTIQVDGGINESTALKAYVAGARNMVAGTYLFKAPDMKKAADAIRF